MKSPPNPEFFLHHIAAFMFIYSFIQGNLGATARFIPHVLVTELSSIVFIFGFFMRASGYREKYPALFKALMMLFAVCFFFMRIIHMPLSMYALVTSKSGSSLFFMQLVLVPILGRWLSKSTYWGRKGLINFTTHADFLSYSIPPHLARFIYYPLFVCRLTVLLVFQNFGLQSVRA